MFLAPAMIAVLLQAAPVDPEKEPFQTLETKVSGAIQAKDVAALDELLAKDFGFMAFLEGRAPVVLSTTRWSVSRSGISPHASSATWRSSGCSRTAWRWQETVSAAAANSPSSTCGPRTAMPGS